MTIAVTKSKHPTINEKNITTKPSVACKSLKILKSDRTVTKMVMKYKIKMVE